MVVDSSFSGFDTAIRIHDDDGTDNLLTVMDSQFSDNSDGIRLADNANGFIVGNWFMNNSNGVLLEVADEEENVQAQITENVFWGNDNGVLLDLDDGGNIDVEILSNTFDENDDAVDIRVDDHDTGDIRLMARVWGNDFLNNFGAGVKINVDDADSYDDYGVEMDVYVIGNRFIVNLNGVDMEFDNDGDADQAGFWDINVKISDNLFESNLEHGIRQTFSWSDAHVNFTTNIHNNQFLENGLDGIHLVVDDSFDQDEGEGALVRTIIYENTFVDNTNDAIHIDFSNTGDASLWTEIVGNQITGGTDGLDITIDSHDESMLIIGGNKIMDVSDTGIRLAVEDSTVSSGVPGAILDNEVTGSGTDGPDCVDGVGQCDFTGSSGNTGTIRVNGTDENVQE
ncbi:MAG: hypothetical protein IH848_08125 [Acidobacteria bacterium]|nr:hypothetical protein [Acidobacteriota bacterium]